MEGDFSQLITAVQDLNVNMDRIAGGLDVLNRNIDRVVGLQSSPYSPPIDSEIHEIKRFMMMNLTDRMNRAEVQDVLHIGRSAACEQMKMIPLKDNRFWYERRGGPVGGLLRYRGKKVDRREVEQILKDKGNDTSIEQVLEELFERHDTVVSGVKRAYELAETALLPTSKGRA